MVPSEVHAEWRSVRSDAGIQDHRRIRFLILILIILLLIIFLCNNFSFNNYVLSFTILSFIITDVVRLVLVRIDGDEEIGSRSSDP